MRHRRGIGIASCKRGVVCALMCVVLGGEAFAQVKAQLPRRIGMPQGGTPHSRGPVWSTPAPIVAGGGVPRAIGGGFERRAGGAVHDRGDAGRVRVSAGESGHGIRFHVGQDPALMHGTHGKRPGHRPGHGPGHRPKYRIIYVPTYYGYSYFYSPYGYWYRTRSRYAQIDGVYIERSEPERQPDADQEPQDPPTEAETGAYYLRRGKPAEAVLRFRKHLAQEPGDTDAMRGLAIALLVDGRFAEGHAMMAMAYRENPALADDPIDPTHYFGRARDFERATHRCTIQANRSRLGGAFLTVAVLMQAGGNADGAVRVVGKARGAGLEVEVADALQRALGG